MSRRETGSAPPRIGQDDDEGAFEETTKVGEMSPEVKAHLRAEGVLPESDSLAAAKPSARPPLYSAVDDDEPAPDEVTKVYAELPAQEVILASEPRPPPVPSRPPPPPRISEIPSAMAQSSTSAGVASSSFAPPPQIATEPIDVRAFGGRSKTKMLLVLIAAMVLLVVFAFVMALVSQRR